MHAMRWSAVPKQIEPRHIITALSDMYLTFLLILLYGSETWALLAGDRRRLQSFHVNCQRQLLGIKWHFHTRNMDITDTTGLPSIQDIINNQRLALFRHVVRRDARIPAHQALKLSAATRSCHQPDTRWSRASGRPRYSWVQQIVDGTPLSLRAGRHYRPPLPIPATMLMTAMMMMMILHKQIVELNNKI